MSIPLELWKKWEGRVVDEKFHLQQWLGGSDDGAVFLTERSGINPQKCAIKLAAAESLDSDAQLSRWTAAARLPHPHLIRLFEFGRCQIDGVPLLFVVMEYAEETLAEVLPLRALSAAEVSEMVQPSAEALAALHRAGFVHGHVKPSNVLAADNQLKLSSDTLRKVGELSGENTPGVYAAPEISRTGPSPAADIWSLGITLLAVLTQSEPKATPRNQPQVVVPENLPQPLRGILQTCLQLDPAQRGTADALLRPASLQFLQQRPTVPMTKADRTVDKTPQPERPTRWIIVPVLVAALFIVAWIGSKFMGHPSSTPSGDSGAIIQQAPPADGAATQSSSPSTATAHSGAMRGSVLHQTMPDISRGAQSTIRGRVKVSVQVAVDPSGKVSQAKLVSPGPSRYFAARSLAAARLWKFNPPQVNGQASFSEWILRFEFGRTSTKVFSSETKP